MEQLNLDLLGLVIATLAMSYTLCFAAYKALGSLSVLDVPGERSNHKKPTPVGGGVGFSIIIALMLWVTESLVSYPEVLTANFIAALLLLTFVSLLDDVRHLPVSLRIFAQAVAIVLVIRGSSNSLHIIPQLSLALNMALVAVAWFWFINLFNFMDGIDGIAASEAIAIAAGITLIGSATGLVEFFYIGLFIAVSVIPFLFFNWSPAKIFMGDSGSISLGFLLGFVLISLAAKGFLAAGLILPAYFVSDATVTIIRRIKAKEKIWQAHSRHYYQQVVRSGFSHNRVVTEIAALNMVLIGLAYLSVKFPASAFLTVLFAYCLCAVLMMRYSKIAKEQVS